MGAASRHRSWRATQRAPRQVTASHERQSRSVGSVGATGQAWAVSASGGRCSGAILAARARAASRDLSRRPMQRAPRWATGCHGRNTHCGGPPDRVPGSAGAAAGANAAAPRRRGGRRFSSRCTPGAQARRGNPVTCRGAPRSARHDMRRGAAAGEHALRWAAIPGSGLSRSSGRANAAAPRRRGEQHASRCAPRAPAPAQRPMTSRGATQRGPPARDGVPRPATARCDSPPGRARGYAGVPGPARRPVTCRGAPRSGRHAR